MFLRIFFLVLVISISAIISPVTAQSEDGNTTLARLKYQGGGDWYNDPSALTNLIRFAKSNYDLPVTNKYDNVDVGSSDLFDYPFAFLTGHGNVTMNRAERENLSKWLKRGGFLFIDDDYGLDEYIRPLLNNLIEDSKLVELPFEHQVYQRPFSFPDGLPKIHEHDGKAPQGFALFYEGRMVLFYAYESNLGDGWADPEIHNTPSSLRTQALRMGTNLLMFALVGG
jgi:hypothetical protein